jgi:hypothetical protein
MNSDYSPAFLERIASYPANIQTLLQTELDTELLQEFLSVLHAQDSVEPERFDALMARQPLVDAMLTKLMLSRKFDQVLAGFLAVLENGDPAQCSTQIDVFFRPLADPERPYRYKLDEVIHSPAGNKDGKRNLHILQELIDFNDRVAAYPNTLRDILRQEILLAGTPEGTPFLSCLMAAFGGPANFRGQAALPPGFTVTAGAHFVRTILPITELEPDPRDIETLKAIARERANTSNVVRLYPPAPLTAVLTSSQTDTTKAFWSAFKEDGLLDEVITRAAYRKRDAENRPPAIIEVPAHVDLSPLLLAYLRCSGLEDDVLDLRVSLTADDGRWEDQIRGYSDQPKGERIGRFRTGPQKPGVTNDSLEIFLLGEAAVEDENGLTPTRHVDIDSCYAIVLMRKGTRPSGPLLNLDNCVVCNDIASLVEEFSDASARVLQKPVIIIGPQTPQEPELLVTAVQAYWSYSGFYPVTHAEVTYDGESERFAVIPAQAPTLSGLTLTDLTTLPLSRLLGMSNADRLRAEESGIMLVREALAICEPRAGTMTDNQVESLNRSTNLVELTNEDREAIFLGSLLDHDTLSNLSPIAHWPVARLLNHAMERVRHSQTLLREFDTAPSTRAANGILFSYEQIADIPHMIAPIDRFALELSARPGMVLKLDDAALSSFLKIARITPSMDRIAANLAVCSSQICRGNRNHIIPLFEFLACGLPAPALQSALAFAAADNGLNKRARYRVAECMRRYGTTDLQLQFLVQLHESGSDLLGEADFLRMFQKLLSVDTRTVLSNLIGQKVVDLIASTLDFKDTFKNALDARDRDKMIAMMTDPNQVKNVEFIKWMDSLRSHSNELYEARLPVGTAVLPQLSSIYGNKLMGAVFSDVELLEELRTSGLLEDGNDLSLISHNILRDNGPLNAFLADHFEGSNVTPLMIEGETTEAVFANAAQATSGQARSNEGPRVSVIISAYNADLALLKLSLSSVLNQTHSNVEVFVVDDASEPENSAAIKAAVEEHEAVTYIRLDNNSGPYVGRNLAIERATGEFIAIQDADDWSHPARFAQQLAAFAESEITQLVTVPHIRIDLYGRIQMEAQFSILGDGPMTSMFRKSVFDTVGDFASVRSRGDVEMRERMRGYYGSHTMKELDLPMMLCFAGSQTLSQKTKSEKHEFLQLFRSNISNRRPTGTLRRSGQPLGPDRSIAVPLPLRPTEAF